MIDQPSEQDLVGARAYEELHVPALFQEWVGPVLDAAHVKPGRAVVDVACGTGVLARGAKRRVGSSGSVIGVDPNPGMLGVAREIDASIDWRQGVAESLPLQDGSVNAVVSQFGMMFFTDRPRAAAEMGRVLQPEGWMAVAVWDGLENQPAYAAEVALLDRIGGTRAGDALRAPFALGDPAEVTGLFEEAGFRDVEVSTRVGTGRFPDIRTLVNADLRGWLPVMGVHLGEDAIRDILDAADREMAEFVVDGALVFDSPAHIISCRRP
jgi:SAM-dependent methyltransferase